MNNLPTAGEYLLNQGVPEEHLKNLPWFDFNNLLTWLEEYSKLKADYYVEKALEAASEKAKRYDEYLGDGEWDRGVDKESILSAYPKENIIESL